MYCINIHPLYPVENLKGLKPISIDNFWNDMYCINIHGLYPVEKFERD